MPKRFFLAAVIVAICSIASAQNKGTIKGILKDSASKQILPLATVTVFTAKDTSIVTYRLSDPTGTFQVPGIPFNLLCRVVISFQGYKTYRKEFTLTKETSQLDLGTIFLPSSPHMLDDVVITAERPPVVMRNDTLEFNANAFKTLPSALVEDLLKKLPGVDVDLDGNITVKGKKVNRLLVDGKEFFGGDHKLATRNLPANIVDKIQVTDDQEELESNPQMTRDEVGQVLNIKLKKAIRQGWFGKAYAGGGTDSRHEAGAIINIFRDTTQISLIGYSNNVNKPAFGVQDIERIGGFNRSGINSMSVNSDGGFAINGVSFGGTSQGIQESRGGGFNFNNQFGKKLTLNLQYFYGQVNSDYEQFGNYQRFFTDTVIATSGFNNRQTLSKNHRIAGSINWKIDSMTQLIYRPNIVLSKNDNYSFSSSNTIDNYKGPTNADTGTNRGTGNAFNLNQTLSLTRRFKKKGRILNISTDLSLHNSNNDFFNDVSYTFYTNYVGRDSLVNQLRGSGNDNVRGNMSINFTEPFTKSTSLILTNQTSYLKEGYGLNFFDMDPLTHYYNLYSDAFSNNIEKAGWKNNLSATLSIRIKKWMLRPGVMYQWASLENQYLHNPNVKQNFNYIFPTLTVSWNSFNLSYRANVNEPSSTDLQQVIDVSYPLYKRYGNPYLRPQQNHSVNLSYYKYSQKGHSFNFNLSGSTSKNSILRQTIMDARRVQESRPVNIDGVKSAYAFVFYNRQYKFNKNFRLSASPNFNVNYNQNYVSFNGAVSKSESFRISGSARLFFNYKDMFELNQGYSVNLNKTWYSDQERYKNIDYTTRTSESEIIIRWPKHFVWESIVNYTYNPRVGSGIRKAIVRWNAGASFLFLKQDKGQIKLSAYDLLGQNVNVYRYNTENSISDIQMTALQRYYMLSFIYNIRSFSGGKVGGKDRTFGFF